MDFWFNMSTHARTVWFVSVGLFVAFVAIPAAAVWAHGWEYRRAAERQRARAERWGGER